MHTYIHTCVRNYIHTYIGCECECAIVCECIAWNQLTPLSQLCVETKG